MDLSRGQKLLIVFGIAGILVGVLILSCSHLLNTRSIAPVAYVAPQAPAQTQQGYVAVHLVGAVMRPGLYWLAPGARLEEAVRLAGGLQPQADPASVNLAARVQDGQQITVRELASPVAAVTSTPPPAPPPLASPALVTQPVVPPPSAVPRQPAAQPVAIVSLNRATYQQLEAIPGIGPQLAARILYYRDEQGGFRSVEDLKNVKGIGDRRLEAIRPYLCP